MKQRRREQRRVYGLDFIRTLALAGVLVYHAFPSFLPGGFFGVASFFVISGFLTAYSSAGRKDFSVAGYYFRRILRIYPQLLIVIFVTIAVLARVDRFRLINAPEEVRSVLLAYNNYWQIRKRADYFANLTNNSAFTHLWYVSILLQFELVWPWLCLILKRSRNGSAVLFIIMLASLFIMPVRVLFTDASVTELYYGTLSRVHALLAGVYAGWRCARNRRRVRQYRRAVPEILGIVYIIVTAVVYFRVPGTAAGVYRYGLVLYALLCALVTAVCAGNGRRNIVIRDYALCRFLSRYSYEIYLWQYPVLFVFGIAGLKGPVMILAAILLILILSIWLNAFAGMFTPRRRR